MRSTRHGGIPRLPGVYSRHHEEQGTQLLRGDRYDETLLPIRVPLSTAGRPPARPWPLRRSDLKANWPVLGISGVAPWTGTARWGFTAVAQNSRSSAPIAS